MTELNKTYLFIKQTTNLLSSLLIILFVTSCEISSKDTIKAQKPNIILIMADDLGYETIGSNGGSSYQTPEIDKMATNGMRFEHCYAQPLCTPSRVQIMTGIYNVRNYVKFGILDPGQTTFGHILQQAGYTTAIIGKWQLGKDRLSPVKAGFDKHCLWQVTEGATDSVGRDTRYSKPELQIDGELKNFSLAEFGPEIVSDYGLEFIEKNSRNEKPFFLYYPMILTHCPFSPTPDSPEWKTDSTTVMKYKGKAPYFVDMMSYTDRIVGRINAKIKELGIEENTLVIFTGDNGTDRPIVSVMNDNEIAGAKNQSTDAGTRVPLVVSWPGKIMPNTINSNLIDFSDFFPSLAEVAQIKTDTMDIDGKSFLSQLKGEEYQPREWIYSWYSRNGAEDKAKVFARTQDYKLYDTGDFYKISEDRIEENPIPPAELKENEKLIYQELQKVLDKYHSKRLDKIKPTG